MIWNPDGVSKDIKCIFDSVKRTCNKRLNFRRQNGAQVLQQEHIGSHCTLLPPHPPTEAATEAKGADLFSSSSFKARRREWSQRPSRTCSATRLDFKHLASTTEVAEEHATPACFPSCPSHRLPASGFMTSCRSLRSGFILSIILLHFSKHVSL